MIAAVGDRVAGVVAAARAYWPWVLAIVVALAAGFTAGRFFVRPQVEIRTETKTEWRDREVVKEVKVKGETVYVDRVVYRTIDTRKEPNGTMTTHTVERSDTDTHRQTTETSARDAVTERQGQASTVQVVTPVLPQWRAAVLAGASLKSPLLPVAGPLVLGLEVDRRIVGPFWLGVWAQTQGSAGVSLSAEF